jgi:SAM-dependent methyltransferase
MKSAKKTLNSIPLVGPLARNLATVLRKVIFPGSQNYWEARYAGNETSGAGSFGKWAEFKAQVVNSFVKDHEIGTVIEFGCGDGNQLSFAEYPAYVGLDVSKSVIELCRERFKRDKNKSFYLYDPDRPADLHFLPKADLCLSLDVIYHLVEDNIFELYMRHLFSASDRFVIVYSTDSDVNRFFQGPHIKHRRFSKWVKTNLPEWKLIKTIPNKYGSEDHQDAAQLADFFIYQKAR